MTKSNDRTWNDLYRQAWDAEFEKLCEGDQVTVKAAPAGDCAGHLSARAWRIADAQYEDQKPDRDQIGAAGMEVACGIA